MNDLRSRNEPAASGIGATTFSPAELRDMAERASTLRERREGQFAPRPSSDLEAVDRRLARWELLAARRVPAAFERRLRWDGLDPSAARSLLGDVHLTGEALPAWTDTLNDVAAAIEEAAADAADCLSIDPNAPLPFERLLVPFMSVARRRILGRVPRYTSTLSRHAQAGLERGLLVRLAQACFPTLNLEFSIHDLRTRADGAPDAIFGGPLGAPRASGTYAGFVTDCLAGGKLRGILLEYAALARLCCEVLDQWVEASDEFLARLHLDWPAIERDIAGGKVGAVVGVRPLFSDAHNRGRGVVGVRFDTGLRVMYKPKDLRPDERYFALVGWLNGKGIDTPLRVLRAMVGDGYGWSEYAEAAPCATDDERRRFYRRSGMQLAIVHALRGTDFHLENAIACGEQPVLVDLETLLAPRFVPAGPQRETTAAQQHAVSRHQESVIATHMLPVWAPLEGDDQMDLSGLGALRPIAREVHAVQGVNSDAMELVRLRATVLTGNNSPFADAESASVVEYVEDIAAGFSAVTALLARHHAELSGPGGVLCTLGDAEFRLVLRATALYSRLQELATQPHLLRHGVDRSIEFEGLARAWLHGEDRPALWGVVHAEAEALERMDIPHFTFRGGSTEIHAFDTAISGALSEPPTTSVAARLAGLAASQDEQLRVLRTSLYTLPRAGTGPVAVPHSGAAEPFDGGACLAAALEVGRHLRDRAVSAPDGSRWWLGLHHEAAAGHRAGYQALEGGLYTGIAGLLVYFAALEHAAPTGEFASLASALDGVVRQSTSQVAPADGDRIGATLALGMVDGIGSALYAAGTIAQLTGRIATADAAATLVPLLTADRIAADSSLSVMRGAAGAAIGLLKLHAAAPNGQALALAELCGRRLLAARDEWRASGGGPWLQLRSRGSSIAHGVAGAALAFLRLNAATGDAAYLDAAAEELGEASAADAPGWCGGEAGALVARLALHRSGRSAGDLEATARRLAFSAGPITDDLCCGEAGVVGALATAADVLGQHDLLATARERASRMVARARTAGTFRFYAHPHPAIENPALFRGVAGVGYALLRLGGAGRPPCLLTFE